MSDHIHDCPKCGAYYLCEETDGSCLPDDPRIVCERDAEIARLRDDCADWEAKYMGLRARVEAEYGRGRRSGIEEVADWMRSEVDRCKDRAATSTTIGGETRWLKLKDYCETAEEKIRALADKEQKCDD